MGRHFSEWPVYRLMAHGKDPCCCAHVDALNLVVLMLRRGLHRCDQVLSPIRCRREI